MNLIIGLLLLITGCADQPTATPSLQMIDGRVRGLPIYRAEVPHHWHRQDPSAETPLDDTTQPICEFSIDEQIRITIHNFPDQKIPPTAQVTRWKRQLNFITTDTTPVAWGGFAGLQFYGEDKNSAVLAWAMQIAPEHYRTLSKPSEKYRQMRADYTIKVTGPTDLIESHRNEIISFANSFELIEAIPTPL